MVGGEFPKRNIWHDALFGKCVLLLFLLLPYCAHLFIPPPTSSEHVSILSGVQGRFTSLSMCFFLLHSCTLFSKLASF